MIIFPNAKINLGLNVVARRPDGYHDLETIFFPIHLQDALEVTRRTNTTDGADYSLHVSGTPLDGDSEDNLVVKAFRLLRSDWPQVTPVDIHLFKHIPTGAGLGGGSADAAFMIRLLNDKFELHLTEEQMERYAARLGADCAFFIRNRPALATGIGDVLTPIDLSLSGYHIVLIKPDIFVPTREAYSRVQPRRPAMPLREVAALPVSDWREVMHNDFEESVFHLHPAIAAIKDKLYDLGAVYASMSGSGSAVYGLFTHPLPHVDEIFSRCFCRQREITDLGFTHQE